MICLPCTGDFSPVFTSKSKRERAMRDAHDNESKKVTNKIEKEDMIK